MIENWKKFEFKWVWVDSEKVKEETANSLNHVLSFVTFDWKDINWVKQNDWHSCGYFLIFNCSNFVYIPNFEWSIDAIFEKINELNRTNNRPELWRTQFLTTIAMNEYFMSKWFQINPLLDRDDLEQAEDRLRNKDFSIIYTTTWVHFRWIVMKDWKYVLLDSFKDGPEFIDFNRAMELIRSSVWWRYQVWIVYRKSRIKIKTQE